MTTLKCDACARSARVLDWNNECEVCADGNPIERAAIALHADLNGGPWGETWFEAHEDLRRRRRENARDALTAAIDVEELTQLLTESVALLPPLTALDIAETITTHYLGNKP